jgi:transcription elongation GreA/GreB family factor
MTRIDNLPYTLLITMKGREKLDQELKSCLDNHKELMTSWTDNDERDGNPLYNSNPIRDILRHQIEANSENIRGCQVLLGRCQLIKPNRNIEEVVIGSIVEYEDITNPKVTVHVIEIVGFNEDELTGTFKKISYLAPVAQAMMNKGIGEEVTFWAARQERTLKILALHSDWPTVTN